MQAVDSIQEEILVLRKKLKEKEVIFDEILESTLAGYWDWHIQDNYEYLSPTFKKMFGYEDHEMENSPESWQKIIHPEDLPKVFEIFEKHVTSKGEYLYDSELRYYHKDGSIVWVYCRGKVIEWDDNYQPVRMVGCHVDITPFKNAEKVLERSEQLEIKNKELEQFAYVASHDLQEPLRTVTSFIKLLNEEYIDQLDENAGKYLAYINEATGRMGELIKGLLDYSRIGRNTELEEVDCNEILINIQKDLTKVVHENKVTLKVGQLPKIQAYPTELRLLLQNLIVNAIKFRKADEHPVIAIAAERVEGHWQFAVSDNGIGIAKENMDRIFMIFQRLHLRNEYEGNGIGLAHCLKIAELHEGRIWVESELNQGSTFYFTIET